MLKEKFYRRQRSRVQWLKEGNRNSKFFLVKASKCRSNNTNRGLRNESSVWTDKEEKVADIIKRYYNNLFSFINPTDDDLNIVTRVISSKISEDQNQMLTKPFKTNDVCTTIRQFHHSNALGPDGYSTFFFQNF